MSCFLKNGAFVSFKILLSESAKDSYVTGGPINVGVTEPTEELLALMLPFIGVWIETYVFY